LNIIVALLLPILVEPPGRILPFAEVVLVLIGRSLPSLKHFVGPLLLLPLPLLIFLPISFNTHLQLKFPRLMVVPSLLGQITLLSTEQSMSEPTTDPNGELSLANFLLPEKITPGQLVYNLSIFYFL
jgi:hypothetical protein